MPANDFFVNEPYATQEYPVAYPFPANAAEITENRIARFDFVHCLTETQFGFDRIQGRGHGQGVQ